MFSSRLKRETELELDFSILPLPQPITTKKGYLYHFTLFLPLQYGIKVICKWGIKWCKYFNEFRTPKLFNVP